MVMGSSLKSNCWLYDSQPCTPEVPWAINFVSANSFDNIFKLTLSRFEICTPSTVCIISCVGLQIKMSHCVLLPNHRYFAPSKAFLFSCPFYHWFGLWGEQLSPFKRTRLLLSHTAYTEWFCSLLPPVWCLSITVRDIFSFQIVYDANTRNPRAIVCSLSSHQILDVCHLVFLLLAVYPLTSAIWHIKCVDMSMHFEIACTTNNWYNANVGNAYAIVEVRHIHSGLLLSCLPSCQ